MTSYTTTVRETDSDGGSRQFQAVVVGRTELLEALDSWPAACSDCGQQPTLMVPLDRPNEWDVVGEHTEDCGSGRPNPRLRLVKETP